MASQRDTETVKAAETCRRAVPERAQQQRLIFTRNTWIKIEVINEECRFCDALKWKEEAAGMCCSGRKVALLSIEEPVEPLKELFSYETDESSHFLKKH
ncbi:uncharacterized protein TNCV_4852241 [Trichonephila clavipes]|nr:uncharacterized protein TNCV_4852241 [Trichonephila clavipes]